MRIREASKRGGGMATIQVLARLALAIASLALFACLSRTWQPTVYDVARLTPLALFDHVGDEPRALRAVPPGPADGSLQLSMELEDELEDEPEDEGDDVGGAHARAGVLALRAQHSLPVGARGESPPGARASRRVRPWATLEQALPRGPPCEHVA